MKRPRQHRPMPQPAAARPGFAARLSERVKTWWLGKNQVFQFVAGFAGLLVLFYALTLTPWSSRSFRFYLNGTVLTANALLRALGQGTTVSGTSISSAVFSVDVRRGCDGLEPVGLFAAAVLAFPLVGFRHKGWGLVAGVAGLLALNQV